MATVEPEMYLAKKNSRKTLKLFIDVETSGFNCWQHSILSMAVIVADDELNKIAEFYEECKPNKLTKSSWSRESERVHGFTPRSTLTKQSEKELCEKLYRFLEENMNGERGYLYFHADSKIDYKFLIGILFKNMETNFYDIYKWLFPYGHVNTMSVFRQKGFKSYGLDKMANHFGIRFKHHNALADTRVLLEICQKIKEEEKNKVA